MYRLNRTVCFLFCFNLLLCALASRLVPIMEPIGFLKNLKFFEKYLIPGSLSLTLLLSTFSLFMERPKLILSLLLASAAVLAHSFTHIYWPSLRWDVPVQDFLLSDTVSANYSFDAAKLYLKHVMLFLVPSLVFLKEVDNGDRNLMKLLGITLLLIVIPNVLVAILQGAWNIEFLNRGSGTAVTAKRAVGLLEDGGASAIYFALLASGFLSVFLLGRLATRTRVYCGLLLFLSTLAGIMSGGRAFFVCLFVPAFFLGLFSLGFSRDDGHQGRKGTLKALSVSSFLILACVVLWNFAPPSFRGENVLQDFQISKISDVNYWNELFLHIDPIRPVHIKAMFAAFWEHPWKGTGLGFFYANLFEYKDRALKEGGILFSDPPEFYPMVLSELGFAGVFVLLLLTFAFVRKVYLSLRKFRHTSSEYTHAQIVECFVLGMSVSLLLSFWIGVHLIFRSVASFGGIVFAWFFFQGHAKAFKRVSRYLAIAFTSLLFAGAIYQWWTAPRAPEFRWEARGKAQVPLSLPLGGKLEFNEKGVWLSSGGELLLSGDKISFLVKRPQEFYPVTVKTLLYNAEGVQQFEFENSVMAFREEGAVVNIKVDGEFAKNCAEQNTPEHFCSFRIFVDPRWRMKKHSVGVYVYANSYEVPHG